MGCKACGGDAVDAHAHSPPPDNPTFASVDDAYYEWCLKKCNVWLNKSDALPSTACSTRSSRIWKTVGKAHQDLPPFVVMTNRLLIWWTLVFLQNDLAILTFSISQSRIGKKLVMSSCHSFLGLSTQVMTLPSLLDGFCMHGTPVASWDIIKHMHCISVIMRAYALWLLQK